MVATLQTYLCPHNGHWPLRGQILLVPECLHPFPIFRALPVPLFTICYWQFDSQTCDSVVEIGTTAVLYRVVFKKNGTCTCILGLEVYM